MTEGQKAIDKYLRGGGRGTVDHIALATRLSAKTVRDGLRALALRGRARKDGTVTIKLGRTLREIEVDRWAADTPPPEPILKGIAAEAVANMSELQACWMPARAQVGARL